MALELRHRGPLTVDDLAELPDDGRRYELVDGTLVVTPSPNRRHQRVSLELAFLLRSHIPPHLEVLTAPFDVQISDVTMLEPDLLVIHRDDPADKSLRNPPLLVVEVLSPSTRRYDLLVKRDVYEGFGVAAYWLVDPEEPSVAVLELADDGVYREIARVSGDAELEVSAPFPLTLVPARLIR